MPSGRAALCTIPKWYGYVWLTLAQQLGCLDFDRLEMILSFFVYQVSQDSNCIRYTIYIYIIDLSEPAVPIFASVVRGFCRRPCFFGHQKRSRRPASTRAFRLLSEMETDTVEIPQPSWKVLGIMWWLLLTMVVITIWLFNIAMENDNF